MPLDGAERGPMQPLLQGGNSGGVADFPARSAIGHIESIDRRALLGTDTRKGDRHAFFAESGKQLIKQSEAVRRLNLNECVSWMRLVLDGYASRKIHPSATGLLGDFPSRPIKKRRKIKAFVAERIPKRRFNEPVIAPVCHRVKFHVAHSKNVQHDVVAAGVNIGAQDIDWNDGKRACNFGEKL